MMPSVSDLIATISLGAMLPTSESDSVTGCALASTATTCMAGMPPPPPAPLAGAAPSGFFLQPTASWVRARTASKTPAPARLKFFSMFIPLRPRRTGQEQIHDAFRRLAVQPTIRQEQVRHQIGVHLSVKTKRQFPTVETRI